MKPEITEKWITTPRVGEKGNSATNVFFRQQIGRV